MQSRLLAAKGAHSEEIVLILLDQNSLEWAQKNLSLTWPWPRELYAAILDNCRRHQARAVGFDVLFTENSSFGVDDDLALGQAIAGMGSFAAGSVFSGTGENRHRQWPADTPRPAFLAEPEKNHRFPSFQAAIMPIQEVARPGVVLCNVHQDPDNDGIYRSLYPLSFFDRQPLPALGLGVYLAAHPQSRLAWNSDAILIDGARIPVDHQGKALLRFRGPSGSFTTVSAAAILAEELALREGREVSASDNKEKLRGKFVFFGFSAPGLFDLRPAPVGGIFSGVEINATLLDNLLNNDFIAPIPQRSQMVILGLLVVLAGFLTAVLNGPLALTILSGFFLLLPPLLSTLCFHWGFRLELLPLLSGVGVTLVLTVVIAYQREGRQRKFIKHSFRHYLSPHVIEQLLEHPEQLRLGGDRKEISIFFSDLQGFTTISEGLEPEALTTLLNDYLSAMTDIILEEDGTVDKYEGDAIIAFWNAPLVVPDHAVRAVRAALRCQERLAELRPRFKEQSGHDLYMRIGINSGPAVVGNLGSSSRFDYTMLGDSVNLAARLEGANKQFGSFMMISHATREQIGDAFPCRELARLTVVGRQEPVRVYEPFLAATFAREEETCRRFQQGLEAFYKGHFSEAIRLFALIAEHDPPAAHYLRKCQQLAEDGAGEDWQGVWSLTSK
jgi:adenylate cyclase